MPLTYTPPTTILPTPPFLPTWFRLGELPIMICVVEEDGQYGVGVSISSSVQFAEGWARNAAERSAHRALEHRRRKLAERAALRASQGGGEPG